MAPGTARPATRGPRSAPLRARLAQRCDWGPRASSPGSHALRDRPAPPPGPAPSNPLRGRGPGEPRPRLRAAPGEGRVPRPASRGGRGRAGAGPGAWRPRASPHWLPRAGPPGLSARWRRRRWCGQLAPRSPAPPGARTHRRADAGDTGRRRWAGGQRAGARAARGEWAPAAARSVRGRGGVEAGARRGQSARRAHVPSGLCGGARPGRRLPALESLPPPPPPWEGSAEVREGRGRKGGTAAGRRRPAPGGPGAQGGGGGRGGRGSAEPGRRSPATGASAPARPGSSGITNCPPPPAVSRVAPSSRRCQSGAMGGSMPARVA